ncbi:MAG: NAD(P)-binding domain-containing protein [Acidobacteriota bacterium]
MDTLVSVLIASAVTFFFVRRYLKQITAAKRNPPPKAAAPVKSAPCPRCSRPVPEGSAFCSACGAPMAMWNVHRAQVKTGTEVPAEKGKPRPVINASLCIGCGGCVDACPETGTLELMNGKAILAHAERCVGHAKCITACPTSALSLAFGNVLQTVRVPSVNEVFETNIKGIFIVGELGGMGLIKTAINEGRMVIDHVRKRLEESGGWHPPRDEHGAIQAADPSQSQPYDVIIVGAGPAGLSASLTAHQYGLHYLTLEQGETAATIRNYPRHKFLMAEPIEIPLYGTLYVGDGTKESLLSVWETILANTGVRVRTQEGVVGIRRDAEVLQVETVKDRYLARHVVLALGKRGTPRRLGVPGEDSSKVAYRLIEAETYSGNDILIVGGGDSAVEAALGTSKGGKNRVTLSYRSDDFSRLRARNLEMLKEAEASGRLSVLRRSQVVEVLPHSVVIDAGGQRKELPNEFVFVMIGGESPDNFLQKTGIEIVEKALTL